MAQIVASGEAVQIDKDNGAMLPTVVLDRCGGASRGTVPSGPRRLIYPTNSKARIVSLRTVSFSIRSSRTS